MDAPEPFTPMVMPLMVFKANAWLLRYLLHYNAQRPHQSLDTAAPARPAAEAAEASREAGGAFRKGDGESARPTKPEHAPTSKKEPVHA